MTSTTPLTRLELEVMEHFWRRGEAAVREVLEDLPREQQPAYTTIQTIVLRLEQKGALQRTRKIGNAHLFAPTVSRQTAARRLLDELLRVIGGAAPLVAHLVAEGDLTLRDLRAIEAAEQPEDCQVERSDARPRADSKP